MKREGAPARVCYHTKSQGRYVSSVLQGPLGDRADHLSELTLVWDKGAIMFSTSPELQ